MTLAAKRKNMNDRAMMAANRTPTIKDRIAHAQSIAGLSPIYEQADNGTNLSEQNKNDFGPGISSCPNAPVLVDLALIVENPYNARVIYNQDSLLQLAASIAANGQDTAGIATLRNGKYYLAAGHRRFRALKQLQSKSMKLVLLPDLSDQDLYEVSWRENHEREEQSAMDNSLVWTRLLAEGIYQTKAELAVATGQTPGYISKVLAAADLSMLVRQVIESSPESFGSTILYELHLYEKVAGAERAHHAALAILAQEMSRAGLQASRLAIESGVTRKPKETSRQYKIPLKNGVSNGIIKEWESGRVLLDIKFSDSTQRAELVRFLRDRLSVSE